jgi:glyoxylase-like metal-dependent hydrolase (beta-lactamase superfamily II)
MLPAGATGRSFAARGVLFAVITLCGLLLPRGRAEANPFEYAWQELAPGVWAGIRPDPFELPQEGNTLFIVTERGVVVFDAGGSPAMGQSIVTKVRALTDEPITHVILSHWHGDHMRGLQAIQSAFPGVQVLAHPHARDRIVETRERWLKRRVAMVPNIRKAVDDALAKNMDLAGRALIPEEKAWLEQGLASTEQLDRENQATEYVIPTATFDQTLHLFAGTRAIDIFCPGSAHTAGDLVLWLPQEKIVATGDVVTAPIPLMPSPYTGSYPGVLAAIKALGFTTLVPGHGLVQHDAQYLDLLTETIQNTAAQMQSFVGQGLSREDAVAKADYSAVAARFTHGDPFLAHRFQDYVQGALADAAYLAATGQTPDEAF